jgi:hypothetical protein
MVRQTGLGRVVEEMPLQGTGRTHDIVKAVVVKAYPVGHPENLMGQTLYDVQPLEDLPIFQRIVAATPYAHEETEIAVPWSRHRQPYAPRARSRMEGSVRDYRPGTFVLLQFLDGDFYEPVIIAAMKFGRQGAAGALVERVAVDDFDENGLTARQEYPLDSHVNGYPRATDGYNGTRWVIDNRGNWRLQTCVDRAPIFPGHNGIPASPDPEGKLILSTRGAKVGTLAFVTGKHPTAEEDADSPGRQMRRTVSATDGTIRDATASDIGNMIRRLRSAVGRIWESTRESGDGRYYVEREDGYLALTSGRAELHCDDMVVLDGPKIRLGGAEAPYEITLWPQLIDLLDALAQVFDTHTHSYLPGPGGATQTAVPTQADQASTVSSMKDACKAAEVMADQTPPTNPTWQMDPDA